MSGGLTPTGFIAETTDEILTEINTNTLALVDPALDLSADQPMGQFNGIDAAQLNQLWELMATVYNQMDPDAAEGNLLDIICAVTGTRRNAATYSTVSCNLVVAAMSTVPAGSIANVANQTGNRWVLQADAVNSTGSQATISGCLFQAESPGPQVALEGTLTGIASPVIGWVSVTNPADALPGSSAETDAQLRVKRIIELEQAGSGTLDSIRAALIAASTPTDTLQQAFVFENTTSVTAGDGTPPYQIHVVVWNGTGTYSPAAKNIIAQTIWDNKPAGTGTYGLLSGVAIDSLGVSQTVYFDTAIAQRVYMTMTTTLDSTAPSTYVSLIKTALYNYGQQVLNLGVDVVALAFRAQALTVQGVDDVPVFTLGFASNPVGTTNLPITGTQIAQLAITDITVDDS